MSKSATVIASHTRIKGEVSFDGPALISGRVEGDVIAADTLDVGAEGIIAGNIRGAAVTIDGTVKGDVVASHSCRLGPTARVAGEVCTSDLSVAKGARFVGHVCVGEIKTPEAVQPAPCPVPAPEVPAIRTFEATISRLEHAAAHVPEPVPAMATVAIPMAPSMPTVEILAQNVQSNLQRTPRIIRAR